MDTSLLSTLLERNITYLVLGQHMITRLEGELQAEKVRAEKSAAAEEATKKHIETLAAQITERYGPPDGLFTVRVMTYSHCRTRVWTRTRILNPMVTLYYVEVFTLVQIQIRIPVQRVSRIITVPI